MPKKSTKRKRRDEEDEEDVPHFSDPKISNFFKKHGKFFSIDDCIIFEDGASVDRGGMGTRQEPPDDEHELAKIRLQFCERRYRTARDEFKAYHDSIVGQPTGNYCLSPRDEEEQVATLENLKKKANKARVKVMAAKQEVAATEPAWKSAKKRMEAENFERSVAHQKRLRQVRL